MPQAIEHVYIVDRYGHVIRGYYEDNVTSVITGFAYVDKYSYPLDPLGAIIGGFPASMNGETVTLKASGIAKQMAYSDGDYVISLEHDFDSLDGSYLGDVYLINAPKLLNPHTDSYPIGEGSYEITWKGHKFVLPIKVKSWINYSNCSH